MSTAITLPDAFLKGAVSTKFAGVQADSLGEGIKGGFGIIGYRGKVWSTKFQGDEKPLMREDGDGARASIEVVIVKAAGNIAKIFYEAGFEPGSTAPPDCWSTNGVTPDGAAPKKQSQTCAGCPKNAWGSKVTEAGKQTKACSDSKRLAVVPLNDLKNELMGGPMLLRVPAASLKDLKVYGDNIQAYGFPYFAVATRISFDVAESFPKFVFNAIRPLTDAEADIIIEMQNGPQVQTILNQSVEIVHHEPDVQVAKTPFEQAAQVPQQPAAQPAAAAQTQQPAQPQTPAAVPQQPAQAQAPAPAAPAPRKRRTKAEMEAAAAELAAKRNGGAAPATPAPAQPAAPAAQTQEAAPVVADGAALAAGGDQAIDNFENELDALLGQ